MPKPKTKSKVQPKAKSKAKPKTMSHEKSLKRNYTVSADALNVIDAYIKQNPDQYRKISDFVSEAIIKHGTDVLGKNMPQLSETASTAGSASIESIKKELNRLRLRIIDVEHFEEDKAKMIELLKELDITSKKSLNKDKWREHKAQLSEYLTYRKDWKSFIEKNEALLAPE